MDKDVKETDQRYKIIIAFKNGHIKELHLEERNLEREIVLKDYLKFDRKFTQLPGTIKKIFRDRNSTQQPVYFLLKEQESDKVVLSTIEFQS